MAHELDGKRIAFLVAPLGVEHAELTVPWMAIRHAGGTPILVSTGRESVQTVHKGVLSSETFHVDKLTDELALSACAALVLPGGLDNSDALRGSPGAVRLVADFVSSGKPVAAISHGPGILVDAGVLTGKVLTSWPGLEPEIVRAGGRWSAEEVHFCPDHGWMLITGRSTLGLPEFTNAMVTGFI